MKIDILEQKRKRCYSCSKLFEPYNLFRTSKEQLKLTNKMVVFKLDTYSPKGRKVELCPTCKIQKFQNLGETLSRSKYKISRNTIVRMGSEV
jgi:hypothetical protein